MPKDKKKEINAKIDKINEKIGNLCKKFLK